MEKRKLKLSTELVHTIINLYNERLSLREISDKVDIHHSTISAVVKYYFNYESKYAKHLSSNNRLIIDMSRRNIDSCISSEIPKKVSKKVSHYKVKILFGLISLKTKHKPIIIYKN